MSGEGRIKLVGKSKVKTTAMVDVEKVKGIAEFVEYAATENRMNQMFDKMIELQHPIDMTSTGIFIKTLMQDILKEEIDTMSASHIEPKDITGTVARKAREFWIAKINETAGI